MIFSQEFITLFALIQARDSLPVGRIYFRSDRLIPEKFAMGQLLEWDEIRKFIFFSSFFTLFRVGALGVPLPMDRLNVAQGFEPVGEVPNIINQAGWGRMDTLNDILQDGRLGDIISNIQNRAQRDGFRIFISYVEL